MTAPWNETTLPTLLSNYKLENVFNADEFGLFYQCLPTKTYHLSREKCSGGKNIKVRLTDMAAASATGEKLPMFVVGKSKTLRCFKNIKQLPCRYRSQKKSWMTGDLFGEWIRKLDSSFRAQDRKVVLLIDNCPAHPEIKNLTNINLIFLPPNTTSVLEPMDQGVIGSLKPHYRRRIVCLCIKSLDQNKPLPKITILHAMKNLVSSWNAVSEETIVNCFKKANISHANQQTAVTDADDPFKSLEEELDNLRKLDDNAVQDTQSAESSVEFDSEVVTSASCMSDADILAELIRPDSIEDEDDDDDNDNDLNDNIDDLDCPPPLTRPSKGDIEEALDKLQDLSLFSSYGDEIRSLTLKIEAFLNKERTEGLKQSHLTDFFQVVN